MIDIVAEMLESHKDLLHPDLVKFLEMVRAEVEHAVRHGVPEEHAVAVVILLQMWKMMNPDSPFVPRDW